ncbi:hypothetical protein [uncultured Algimonas sp.]|uniref:hypothetical protein n=1 Tax=uncultured Algimonas sp. TaxID=1547920 RepID=UPI00261899B7|nr:hypothetical protein [uncultured Algimonas sp.]
MVSTRRTLSEARSGTRGIGAARRSILPEFERITADCGGCLDVIYVSGAVQGERRIMEPTDRVSVLSRVTDLSNGADDSPGASRAGTWTARAALWPGMPRHRPTSTG